MAELLDPNNNDGAQTGLVDMSEDNFEIAYQTLKLN